MSGQAPSDRIRVLLVESDAAAAAEVRRRISDSSDVPFEFETAATLAEAGQKAVSWPADAALLSLHLADAPGTVAVTALRERAPRLPVILLVGPEEDQRALAALREGAQDYTVREQVVGRLLARRIRYSAERRRMEEETRLLTTLSLAVGEAKDLDAALTVVMREVCSFTGWAMGMAWIPDATGQRLDPGAAWMRVSPRLQLFREESSRVPSIPGAGLLWVAFHSREPVWCPDLAADARFRRRDAALKAGLRGAVMVPVIAREAVVAVIEFLIQEPKPADEATMPFVYAVCAQLGHVFLRKRSEEAVRESEERLRHIIEVAYNGYLIHEDGAIREITPGCAAVFGCTPAEMIGRNLLDFAAPESRDDVLNRMRSGLEGAYEVSALRKDGTPIQAEVVGVGHRYRGRQARLGAIRDVTARRKSEHRIARLNDCFLSLGPDPAGNMDRLVAFGAEELQAAWGIYVAVEDEACIGFGQWKVPEELLAKDGPVDKFCRGVVAGNGKGTVTTAAAPQRTGDTTLNVYRSGAETLVGRVVRCGGEPAGVLCLGFSTGVDPGPEDSRFLGIIASVLGVEEERRTAARERAELEERLRRSAKMEAVGRLAGGIAHDFNNLLTAIIGYSDLVSGRLTEENDRRDMNEVRRAAERAAGLTRQLLAFSRQQVLNPEALDLNRVVADTQKLLRRVIGEDVALEIRPSPEPALVKADRSQLEQVLVNLAVNAREAMPRGGTLRLELSLGVLPPPAVEDEAEATVSGPCVTLVVSDTGVGMDAETLAHVFEPFFTKKGFGHGAGLGLATVYGIVRQSGGTIAVESEPGTGARFSIHLPRIFSEAAVPAALPPPPPRPGQETVLLVEDEESVRSLAALSLRRLGYSVIEARSGEEACERAGGSGGIDLLLTDVIMPGMSGPEVAKKLAGARPGLRVLYMSGYTDDALGQHGMLDKGIAFMQKPFTPDSLGRRVREVLDQARRKDA